MADTIDRFEGIAVAKDDQLDAIADGARLAAKLAERVRSGSGRRARDDSGEADPALLGLALGASLQSLNALLASASAQCLRGGGNAADIYVLTEPGGQMIYRCKHAPSHEWKLDGSVIK